MNVIHKFELGPGVTTLPAGSIRDIAIQTINGQTAIMVWVEISPTSLGEQQVEAIVTGQYFNPSGLEFVKSVVTDVFVAHIFRRI